MKINLYTTYFKSENMERQQEIDYCLFKNMQNLYINQINIFLDANTRSSDFYHFFDNSDNHIYANKLNFININRVPTYKDWIESSKTNHIISIFANADIYFDESINKLLNYLDKPNSMICLSRYEDCSGSCTPHPNPHWSQDAWAVNTNHIDSINFLEDLNIATGKFRCDNKFAYIMNIHGWDLYNPYDVVKCFHKHESNIRKYNPAEATNIGCLAFVHPCKNLEPSKIDMDIMSLNTKSISKCSINSWLEEETSKNQSK